jgi:hypothetical protein
VRLEELVHLLKHLFDAEADLVALFVESVELGFDCPGVALKGCELLAEGGDFGLGGGAGFALALDDFDGAKDFLFERLELVGANTRADGGGTHISTSIDAADVDSPEGNRGGINLGAGFYGLNIVDGGRCDFSEGFAFCVCFFAGEFVVNGW